MAFLFPISQETKVHRDDEYPAAVRGPAQRVNRVSPLDGTSIPTENQLPDGSGEVLSPVQSAAARRYLVFADPVAFR